MTYAGFNPVRERHWVCARRMRERRLAQGLTQREVVARLARCGVRTTNRALSTMENVFVAVRDMIVEGQKQGAFRDVDPLLTHLTIMPAVLIFFARQRVLARSKLPRGLAAPRDLDEFVRHMQASVRGMLRKEP